MYSLCDIHIGLPDCGTEKFQCIPKTVPFFASLKMRCGNLSKVSVSHQTNFIQIKIQYTSKTIVQHILN